MIQRQTTFILGAGASKPYGFPLGQELVDNIIIGLNKDKLRPRNYAGSWNANEKWADANLIALITEAGYESKIQPFIVALEQSQTNSIDAFLEQRSDYLEIGKMCIAYELLKHEKLDSLTRSNSNWYKYLWNILNTSKFEDLDKNKVSFITFNYDRSLEYFLTQAITAFYGKSFEEAYSVIKKFQIIHLHGKLGSISHNETDSYTEFGENINEHKRLKIISDNIKIIHENSDNSQEFIDAINLINDSSQLYFLGFGYAPTNIRRLGIARIEKISISKGTCFGLTSQEISRIRVQTNRKIIISESWVNYDCLNFIRNVVFFEN